MLFSQMVYLGSTTLLSSSIADSVVTLVFLNITHGGIFCSPWYRKWGAVNEFMIMMIFA